jgi:hypothetical protein
MPKHLFSLIQTDAKNAMGAAFPELAKARLSRRLFCLCAGVFAASKHPTAQAQSEKLLLVCGANSPLATDLTKNTRKIFLGIPITAHKEVITPIMNASSQRTRELFLQRVLYMSTEVYERHQQAKIYRNSGQRIPESGSIPALITLMNQNPCHLSFMLASDLPGDNSVKVLGTL